MAVLVLLTGLLVIPLRGDALLLNFVQDFIHDGFGEIGRVAHRGLPRLRLPLRGLANSVGQDGLF